jgi:hypothetical protein
MRSRQNLLLALAVAVSTLVVTAGCAPPRGFHFDLTADMREYTPPKHAGPEYFAGVCAAIRELGPGAFMIIPGDLDPPAAVRATLDAVLGPEYVMYPVVGNHELHRPEDMVYLREYNRGGETLPGVVRSGPPGAEETCYSFDYRDAHFVVINQYYDGSSDTATDGDVVPALFEWLAADLAATDKPYVFVAGHEPAVAVPDLDNGRVRHRGDSLDKYEQNNHRFWSLLRTHDVVAYFCGHTHNASATKINGVWQIDCGHARGMGDPGAKSTFVKVYVERDGVHCAFHRYNGEGYELAYEERLR